MGQPQQKVLGSAQRRGVFLKLAQEGYLHVTLRMSNGFGTIIHIVLLASYIQDTSWSRHAHECNKVLLYVYS